MQAYKITSCSGHYRLDLFQAIGDLAAFDWATIVARIVGTEVHVWRWAPGVHEGSDPADKMDPYNWAGIGSAKPRWERVVSRDW